MTDEFSSAAAPAHPTRLTAALERLLAARPGLVPGLGIGLALLGYAVPLLFPLATLGLSAHLIGVLAEGGFGALAEAWLRIGFLAISATLTVSLWKLRVAEPGGCERGLEAGAAAADNQDVGVRFGAAHACF